MSTHLENRFVEANTGKLKAFPKIVVGFTMAFITSNAIFSIWLIIAGLVELQKADPDAIYAGFGVILGVPIFLLTILNLTFILVFFKTKSFPIFVIQTIIGVCSAIVAVQFSLSYFVGIFPPLP